MNKTISRLLTFAIGLPLVLFLLWLPYINHLSLHIVVLVLSLLAANEMYNMLSLKSELQPKGFLLTLCGILSLISVIFSIGKAFFNWTRIQNELITFAFIIEFLLILIAEVFTSKDFEFSASRIAQSSFLVLYTTFLFTFISRLAFVEKDGKSIATPLLITVIALCCMSDSIAWLFGILLGKNNRGIFKASPNKSIAGFIGAFIGSIATGILCFYIWRDIYTGSIIKMILISIFCTISSIVGDLAESVLKRSTGVKDSGSIIPGRGGVLDSIDSIIMTAPLFYGLIKIFYGF